MSAKNTLKRSLSLPLLTIYGVGTIVGGGFYALIGEVAAHAGMRTPLAFLVAAFVGLVSALSYAELSARYPVAAGESQYVRAAFHRRWLSSLVGWLVILTGVVSASMLARAFVRFMQDLTEVPTDPALIAITLVLGAVAVWGISESAILATIITFIEVGGILYVVYVGRGHFGDLPARLPEMLPTLDSSAWTGVLLGAFLAFYALIGFEDMVNVAEEVKNPRRTLPIALVLALGITTVLYMAATTVAVLALSPEQLAASRTPLAQVAGEGSSTAMTWVSMLAGVNGALVQLIMASRILYGMGSKEGAPRYFAKVAPATQTPIRATAFTTAAILIFTLWLPLITLARLTSSILLMVFVLVNLSLIVLKRRGEPAPPNAPTIPVGVPVLGVLLCLTFLVFGITGSL